ncbi:hypothetical protein Tco_0478383, partial [Tanacetum coccineum]
FIGYPFDYHVTLGFGSMAGGLDHVNPIIRLPLEHEIRTLSERVNKLYSITGIIGQTKDIYSDNIIDGINLDDLTIEQYLRLIQEHQTPSMVKKVDDMTIAKYVEYEERIKRQCSRNSRSYFPTYFDHYTSSNNTTFEFPRNTIPPNTKFNYNSKDMELDEEAGYTTDEESVMSEHEAIDPVHAVNTQSLEEKLSSEEDLDEWLNAEMEKHMRPHLDKECPLNEEVKQVDEVKYGEFGRPAPFNRSSGAKFRVGPPGYYTRTDNQTSSGEKKPNLVETINKYMEEATKRQAEQDEWLKTFCQNTKNSRIDHDKIIQKLESQVKTLAVEVETKDFWTTKKSKTTEVKTSKAIPEWKSNLPEQTVNHYVEPYVPSIPFPNRLKQHAEEALVHKTMESLKKIKINRPFLKEIRQTDNYPRYMKDLVANKQLTEDDGEVRMNPRSSALL